MDALTAIAPPIVHYAARHRPPLSRMKPTRRLHHLDCMVDAHIGACVFLGVDPSLAPLRDHPRYQAALKRVGVGPQRMASARAYSVDIIGTGTPARAARRTMRSLQRFDLDPFPLRQINQQRRPHRSGNSVDVALDSIDHISVERVRLQPARLAPPRGSLREIAPESPTRRQSGPIGSRDAPVNPASVTEER